MDTIMYDANQTNLVEFVEKAFQVSEELDVTFDFKDAIVNDGAIIPRAVIDLKAAGYQVNSIKSTGRVKGNLLVSISHGTQSVVCYVSPLFSALPESVRRAIASEVVSEAPEPKGFLASLKFW